MAAAAGELVSGRFWLYLVDARKFDRMLVDVGQARYPEAPAALFLARREPKRNDGTTALFEGHYNPEDAVFLQAYAASLRAKYRRTPEQMEALRAEIYGRANAEILAKMDNGGFDYDKPRWS